jgi:polyhydroxyalkanoate synthesis regulator phasin
MKLSFNAIAGAALCSVVLATGGIAWSADKANGVQDEKIAQNVQHINRTLEKVDKQTDSVNDLAKSVAVLAEQVRQLTEEQRRAR